MLYLVIFAYVLNVVAFSEGMDYFNVTTFFPQIKNNLTAVTWAHAVNSQTKLNISLIDDGVMMIEADIILGHLIDEGGDHSKNKLQPIMGHPPETTSDLSLKMFIDEIIKHNNITEKNKKGMKLDFKSIEAFQASVPILRSVYNQIKFPTWLNADVLQGPGENNDVKPVDCKKFLDGCGNFTNFLLSLGWTTKYGSEKKKVSYTDQEAFDILDEILETKNMVTFPVRAGIAANSIDVLKHLLDEDYTYTLTIWSSKDDYVNIPMLRHLISTVGVNRTYLDVPKELRDEIFNNKKNGSNRIGKSLGLIGAALFGTLMFYISNRLSVE